jgi:hypothetical protein
VLPDGLGVGLFDGVVVGLLVGLAVAVLLVVGFGLGFGFGLGEVDVAVGFGLAEVLLVGPADVVGSTDEVPVGFAEDEADELPLGVALADEEVLADDDALADLLGDRVGELVGLADLATLNVTSSRMADLGRAAQVPFATGGWACRVMEAASTSVLDARRTYPASTPSAIGRTSRRPVIGSASSLTPSLTYNCPPWSLQYACPD